MLAPPGPKGPKVLLVDDEELILDLIRHMLKNLEPRHVDIEERCFTALAKLEKKPGYYDIIISDWDVPGLNGLEFLKKAKQIAPNVPFIMVTANSSERLVKRAIEEGVDDYVVKPFTAKSLIDKVERVLSVETT